LRPVHIVSSIALEESGPTYTVVRLCDSLAVQGSAVRLLALDWAPNTNYPAYATSFKMGVGPRRLGRSPSMHRWLAREAAAGGIDLIHAHGLWMMPNVYPGWVAARYGVPLVVSPRGCFTPYAMASGSGVKKIFWPLVQKPALLSVDCFHATAESEYLDIRRMGFKQPVAISPNGIDIPALIPRSSGERRTLLFLGRVHPNKGLDLLLPAWKRVEARFPDWDLVIIGSDDGYHGSSGYRSEMQALSAKLNLQRVRFEGPQYGDDKLRAFRDASAYVLPTYSENFGITVAEALSQATPVIVTKGAPWHGLEANAAGWWIEIGVDPLAVALETVLSLPSQALREMGMNGRAWMEREFNWPRVSQHMASVYSWLRDASLGRPSCVHLD
jgi:glycosyltransferase involved in cell wall biosynthesis